MKWIVITSPEYYSGEVTDICTLLDIGVDYIHLRKPHSNYTDYMALLNELPKKYLNQIVIHEYFDLATKYNVKGIHLNARNQHAPTGYNGQISRSCHSLEEVREYKDSFDYLFLSPLFDSISKEGYHSNFKIETLRRAVKADLIDNKIVGLGGIALDKISLLKDLKFGGAAFLGDIWNRLQQNHDEALHYFYKIKTALK